MASKQVISKIKPLINFTFKNCSVMAKSSLLPNANQPFLMFKSGEMTQATQLTPAGVAARTAGLCRPSPPVCPPPPCTCPPLPEHITLLRRLGRLLWLLTRIGIFASVVKFTVDEGVWGDSEQTEELAKRMGLITEAKSSKEEVQDFNLSSLVKIWNNAIMKMGNIFRLTV